MKDRFDKARIFRKFEVNDHVLVKRKKGTNDGQSRKLLPKYDGPYKVAKVLSRDRYLVKDIPGAQRRQKMYEGVHPSEHLKEFSVNQDSDMTDSSDWDEIN